MLSPIPLVGEKRRDATCCWAEGENLMTSCGHHAPDAPKPTMVWAAFGSTLADADVEPTLLGAERAAATEDTRARHATPASRRRKRNGTRRRPVISKVDRPRSARGPPKVPVAP